MDSLRSAPCKFLRPYCGWTKSISHKSKQPGMRRFPGKMPNKDFSHGFEVVRNGLRPSTGLVVGEPLMDLTPPPLRGGSRILNLTWPSPKGNKQDA